MLKYDKKLFYSQINKIIHISLDKLITDQVNNSLVVVGLNSVSSVRMSASGFIISIFNKYSVSVHTPLCFSSTGDADSRQGAFQSLVPAGAILYQYIAGRDTLSSSMCNLISDDKLLVDRTTRRNKSYNLIHGS